MNELMIPLDTRDKKSLYEQIYSYIKKQIVDGNLSCGEKLPSTRLLAKYLHISRSTVETAYSQLLAEGYLESSPGRGYFVSDISMVYSTQADGRETKDEYHSLHEAANQICDYLVDFSLNQTDMSSFPYKIWRKITKESLMLEEELMETQQEPTGELELRREIKNYLYFSRGVHCTADQIIVGAGNEFLLILLSQILDERQVIAMENPTYLNAYYTFTNMNWKIITVDRDSSGISLEDIARTRPDVVYTMPSHHYPLGTIVPLKRRLELLNWASEAKDRYIIEDDHDSEYRYKGKPIPSLQGSDRNGTVIYLGTFSKSISPTQRMSYMVLPPELLQKYHSKCGFYSSTVPRIQQMILSAFLKDGYFERHLNKMRGIYKAKHDYFLLLLKKEKWVEDVYGDQAGMLFRVRIRCERPVKEIQKEVEAAGIKIYTLSEFMIPDLPCSNKVNHMRKHQIILGYGGLTEEQIRIGIHAIRNAVVK
ncbi:MAG: PLP-dependent aminotransferase family protein [Lachnospiraceae bacterium]